MAVSEQVLARIADPTAGKLGDIGETLARNRQRATENERKRESHELEMTLGNMKMNALEMESKLDEVSFMGDSALSLKAYYDKGGDAEGAQRLWNSHREDATNLGYEMPEQVPDAKMVEGLATKSKQYVNYLNATKASDSSKKFLMIATIAAIPENKRTPAQSRILTELTKPSIAFTVAQPATRTIQIAKRFLETAKKGDIALEGEIEGVEGYQDAILTKALAIQAKSSKGGKEISLSDAMDQAHKELQYKLIPTKTFEVKGWAPFEKKFIYNPDAQLTPEDTGESIEDPSSLKPGESGVFDGIKYQRTKAGKLQKAK